MQDHGSTDLILLAICIIHFQAQRLDNFHHFLPNTSSIVISILTKETKLMLCTIIVVVGTIHSWEKILDSQCTNSYFWLTLSVKLFCDPCLKHVHVGISQLSTLHAQR